MKSQSGFTLIEVAIGTGVLGVLIFIYMQVQHNLQTLRDEEEQKLNQTSARLFILSQLDCSQTLPSNGCIRPRYVTGKTSDGRTIVSARGGYVGNKSAEVYVKVRCSGQELIPEFSKSAGSPFKPMFPAVPMICPPIDRPSNLADCALLGNAGHQVYPSACPAGHAVVVINDGLNQELSCCPLPTGTLSVRPGDQYISRQNRCGRAEVMTGMITGTPTWPVNIYCSRLAPRVSVRTRQNSYLVGCGSFAWGTPIRTLIDMYHNCDTCICPPGSIMIGAPGGHNWADNNCSEQCVTLQSR